MSSGCSLHRPWCRVFFHPRRNFAHRGLGSLPKCHPGQTAQQRVAASTSKSMELRHRRHSADSCPATPRKVSSWSDVLLPTGESCRLLLSAGRLCGAESTRGGLVSDPRCALRCIRPCSQAFLQCRDRKLYSQQPLPRYHGLSLSFCLRDTSFVFVNQSPGRRHSRHGAAHVRWNGESRARFVTGLPAFR